MSKFFVQMFLSVLVAAGAAVGFSPHGKGELHKTFREAKSFVYEISDSIFHTVKNVEVESEVSVEASAESSLESELEANVESAVDTDLDLDFDKSSKKSSKKSSESSIETSLSAESETEAEVEIGGVNLEVENQLETDILR